MTIRLKTQKTAREWFVLLVFYLFLFQSPLSELHQIFAYVDEVFPLTGIAVIAYRSLSTAKLRMQKNDAQTVVLMLLFLATGLLGNLIYRYQPLQAVLKDLYTNMKFFLAIISGYVLFKDCGCAREENVVVGHARMMCTLLFALACVDLVFQVFPSGGERYGIRSVRLFYVHETYLAGAMVFLLMILLAFYEKKNQPYMVLGLIVLLLTLKGKAFAGAVAYVMFTYFFVYYRKKIRLVHVAVIAVAVVLVAWDQVAYYFIELDGESARSVLTTTSFQILKDYFPIGTGFGTYASAAAMEYYSPVYYEYGLNQIWGLSESYSAFGSDTFWPIIIGQTGLIGTVCFIAVLLFLFARLQKVRRGNICAYAAGLFAFTYILISSTAEPAFHNSVSIPLAMMLGYIFTLEEKGERKCLKN